MKFKLLYAILLAGIILCSTESSTLNSITTTKGEGVLNFEKSIKSLSNPEIVYLLPHLVAHVMIL